MNEWRALERKKERKKEGGKEGINARLMDGEKEYSCLT